MMRSICALSVTLFAITFGASAHAAHKSTESFSIKNRGVSAEFNGADNCAVATVNVFYSETLTKTNGAKDGPNPNTFVEIDYQNICTNNAFFLSGTTDQQQVSIGTNLDTAMFTANVVVTTEEGVVPAVSTTVSLNLRWTATGPLSTFKERIHSKGGGVKFKQVTKSDARPGQATGSATAILPLSTGNKFTNLIFAPSIQASLNKNLFGQITVTRILPN